MSIYEREGIWWLDLRHRERRIRRSTRTSSRETAQRLHDELKARLWKERRAGRTLADALVAWLEERTRGRSDINAVKQIRDRYQNRALIDVTSTSILDTFGGKSPPTYNRLVSIIRSAMNLAAAPGWIESAPKFARRKVVEPDPRFLTRKEWLKLRNELPDHVRTMADFAIATGLRWGNVSRLTWDRVDLRNRQIWIAGSQAKSRKPMGIPLSAAAIAALSRVPGKREGFVFLWRGKPIGSAKRSWRAARTRAGMEGFRFHDLRHTWASWHAQAGTPLDVLQKLGGWETREMVERYAHLSPSHVARFADNARVPGVGNAANGHK